MPAVIRNHGGRIGHLPARTASRPARRMQVRQGMAGLRRGKTPAGAAGDGKPRAGVTAADRGDSENHPGIASRMGPAMQMPGAIFADRMARRQPVDPGRRATGRAVIRPVAPVRMRGVDSALRMVRASPMARGLRAKAGTFVRRMVRAPPMVRADRVRPRNSVRPAGRASLIDLRPETVRVARRMRRTAITAAGKNRIMPASPFRKGRLIPVPRRGTVPGPYGGNKSRTRPKTGRMTEFLRVPNSETC